MGTTRRGQLLLGCAGLFVGVGGGLALELKPITFEPILRLALYGIGALFRFHINYDPHHRTFYAILLPVFGTVWALLLGYAFIREPARNRAIDAYLRRNSKIDNANRATIISQDDRPI